MVDRSTEQDGSKKADAMRRTWKGLVLPTVLTIVVATIGATPIHFPTDPWKTVASVPVSLDPKLWHVYDSNSSWVAELGIEPNYFVDYDGADGMRHFVPLANLAGATSAQTGLPTIDKRKDAVRYVLILKNHRQVTVAQNEHVESGGTSGNGHKGFAFKALTIAREGVRADFHPADVKEIRLQVRRAIGS